MQHSAKRRKTSSSKPKPSKPKAERKEKASNRPVIPIPDAEDDNESNISEQDMELLQDYGTAATFLNDLDRAGISRYVLTI